MEQLLIENGFIGEQKKSLGVGVQSTYRVDPSRKAELGKSTVVGSIRSELGQNTERLVESKEHQT
jgi:hypothetical protein